MLQCVAVCCSVFQMVGILMYVAVWLVGGFSECCSVVQCVAVFCSALPCVAVCCSVLQCVAVCGSVLT